MGLDKQQLIDALWVLMTVDNQNESNVGNAINRLANAIEAYVKSGVVQGQCPPNGGPLANGKVI